jgi:hypothetical protein
MLTCSIWGYHSGAYGEFYTRRLKTLYSDESLPTFQSRMSPSSSVLKALCYAGFLPPFFFDQGDGGDMFLRNVDRFSTKYAALHPTRKLINS